MSLRAIVLMLLLWSWKGCHAQHPNSGTQDVNGNTTVRGADQSDQLTGDWDGLRTRLQEKGITLSLAYRSELVGIVHGGSSLGATDVGELFLGAQLSTAEALHWKGGLVRFLATRRHGTNVTDKAGVDLLVNAQELYGKGEVFRLTELSVQQALAGGKLVFKVGRLGSEDFASMDCDFTTQALCGPPPSYLASQYWFISPVGVWAGWLKVGDGKRYVRAGVAEDNRNNDDKGFFLSKTGAKGVLANGEVGLTPRLFGGNQPGLFRIGASYITSCDPDVLLDRSAKPFLTTGSEPRPDCGQTGVWFEGQQQLSGSATQDLISEKITRDHGLEGFFSYFHGDSRTATLIDQFTAGAYYSGLFHARPHDQVGVGLAFTRYNPRANRAGTLRDATWTPRGTERTLAAFYGFHVIKGLLVRTGAQYIPTPGGTSHEAGVIGLDLRMDVTF